MPSMPMPSATTQQCSPKCTPSIISPTSQGRQVLGQQLGQRGLGRGDEPAGDGRLRGAHHGLLDTRADRLQVHRIAPRRRPGQHALHRHTPEHIGVREQLIGGHRSLTGAIAHPRPAHRHPAPAHAHRPGPVPVAGRSAFGVVATLGPTRDGYVSLHHRGHHLQPRAHRQASSPSRTSPASSANATLTCSGTAGGGRVDVGLLVLLLHGGPLPRGVLGGSPEYLPQGRTQVGDRHLNFHESRDNLPTSPGGDDRVKSVVLHGRPW
jgi:hypothetical protein